MYAIRSYYDHQIDIDLLNEIGKEFYRRFNKENITKIITIEASGIAVACLTAQYFHVPVVFAKKSESTNIDGDRITSYNVCYTKLLRVVLYGLTPHYPYTAHVVGTIIR